MTQEDGVRILVLAIRPQAERVTAWSKLTWNRLNGRNGLVATW